MLDGREVAKSLNPADYLAAFVPENCGRDADRPAIAMRVQDHRSPAYDRQARHQGLSQAASGLADVGPKHVPAQLAQSMLPPNACGFLRRPIE
jgi:hypothetical protein